MLRQPLYLPSSYIWKMSELMCFPFSWSSITIFCGTQLHSIVGFPSKSLEVLSVAKVLQCPSVPPLNTVKFVMSKESMWRCWIWQDWKGRSYDGASRLGPVLPCLHLSSQSSHNLVSSYSPPISVPQVSSSLKLRRWPIRCGNLVQWLK